MSVRHTRAPLAAAVVAIGILVAGCGNDSSSDEVTATSLAETSTSQSAEPTTDEAGTDAGTGTTSSDVTAPAPESPGTPPEAAPADPGAAGAPPAEQPAAPGPSDDRGQAFVGGLRERGITVADNGDLAVSTANYICTAQVQGEDQAVINTYVTAMVGSEASAAGVTLTDEQAAQNAATYIEVANATYC